MKQKFISTTLKFLALSLPAIASAQTSNMSKPGYLPEFNYQLSSVDMPTAEAMMKSERRDTALSSICSNRANLWAHNMSEQYKVKVGKMFIILADNTSLKWSYHVVPYTIVNGQEMVLDGGVGKILGHELGTFHKGPTDVATWSNHYSGGTNPCVVLDPVNNPEHLKMEQLIMPDDIGTDGKVMDPLNAPTDVKKDEFTGVRKFPGTDDVRCYIRKVPMFYVFPRDFYGADLALTGDTRLKSYVVNEFDKLDLWDSCDDALKGDTFNKCSDELGFIPKERQ